MGELKLVNPLLILRSGAIAVLVSDADRDNPLADAQLWSPTVGYSEIQPLAVHLKFMYYLEKVVPPQPWR